MTPIHPSLLERYEQVQAVRDGCRQLALDLGFYGWTSEAAREVRRKCERLRTASDKLICEMDELNERMPRTKRSRRSPHIAKEVRRESDSVLE